MDFVLGLSISKRRVDSILKVVDIFSKMYHLIPCKKIHDTSNITTIFFRDLAKLHSIPKTITSDRDVKFMLPF